jgi:uncharacterized cupin superfamily protein
VEHVCIIDSGNDGFEPHDVSTIDDLSGVHFTYGGPGEVKWLRLRRDGERDMGLATGFFLSHIWRTRSRCQFVFYTHADESLFVLEGEAVVESDQGATVTLRAGDCASFAAGQTLTFTVEDSFAEFVTVAGESQRR